MHNLLQRIKLCYPLLTRTVHKLPSAGKKNQNTVIQNVKIIYFFFAQTPKVIVIYFYGLFLGGFLFDSVINLLRKATEKSFSQKGPYVLNIYN